MPRQTGKIWCDVPGQGRVDSRPGATVDFGGPVRTAVESDVAVGNYTEQDKVSEVSLTINHSSDFDEVSFGRLADVPFHFESDSGVHWLLPACTSAHPV